MVGVVFFLFFLFFSGRKEYIKENAIYIYFYFPRKKRKIKKYKSFCGNRSRVVILQRRSME
jgi:hypothetical protein